MDFATMRQVAKGTYGLDRSTTEDPLFTNPVLGDIINAKHKWFAGETLCYYGDITVALTVGQLNYAADPLCIEVDVYNVRFQMPTAWTRLPMRQLRSLLTEQNAALESIANGTPTGFLLRAGNSAISGTTGGAKVISVVPPPSGTGNLRYGCYQYPADLSADGDIPPLSVHEHPRLIPAICWGMAELEQSRGREDAPVDLWHARAIAEAQELAEIIRRGTREPIRTADVAASPLASSQERRASRIGTVAGRPAGQG